MATEREETEQQARPDWEEYVKPNLVIYCESKEGNIVAGVLYRRALR
jgi:hypothetical protein